jgi:hypothetical protein
MYVCQWHLDVPFGEQGEGRAPDIVPGSRHWVVYGALEERRAG